MIFKKYLFYSLGGFLVFFMFVMWTQYDYRDKIDSLGNYRYIESKEFDENEIVASSRKHHKMKNESLKYILIWTSPKSDPIKYLGKGQEVFIKKKCPLTNCYVTSNRTLLYKITDYDIVLFHAPEIHNKRNLDLPASRSQSQLFIYASMESSDYYPLCSDQFNNYFNLTWTYKLKSDIYYGYLIIRNKKGNLIGPNQIMHWEKLENMAPIDEKIKDKLKHKSIAAAWFVSNCKAPSGRDEFVDQVQKELNQYNLVIDIYGSCGKKKCPRGTMDNCLRTIERDYYFYFSFENSFSDDYVTEKLLHALNHYAVPVVYGIANYTRFMPEGIYLNALELGPKELAKQIAEIINDKERYYNFFKWHNHYSYHAVEDAADADPYCKICEKVNDEIVLKRTNVYGDLKEWWNPKKIRPRVCPFTFWR